MRDDLVRLRDRGSRKWRLRRFGFLPAAAACLLVVAAILRWQPAPAVPHVNSLRQRKLTSNSADNPIRGGGQISPDAKYLAYADRLGIHVQVVETGKTMAVPQPEDFDARNSYWSIGAWFPSSTEFLANSRPAVEDAKEWTAEGASAWAFSFKGAPRRIRENAEVFSVSPDGAWIAIRDAGEQEGGPRNLADGPEWRAGAQAF
jgi:hypothetical protein